MKTAITRGQALALLQKYNQEPFHILHGLTVEGIMRYFAQEAGEDPDHFHHRRETVKPVNSGLCDSFFF